MKDALEMLGWALVMLFVMPYMLLKGLWKALAFRFDLSLDTLFEYMVILLLAPFILVVSLATILRGD